MEYRLAQRVNNLQLSATDEIDNVVKRMQRAGIKDIISFGGGEPCLTLLNPFRMQLLLDCDPGRQNTNQLLEILNYAKRSVKSLNDITIFMLEWMILSLHRGRNSRFIWSVRPSFSLAIR